jgi:hypothetical protein
MDWLCPCLWVTGQPWGTRDRSRGFNCHVVSTTGKTGWGESMEEDVTVYMGIYLLARSGVPESCSQEGID